MAVLRFSRFLLVFLWGLVLLGAGCPAGLHLHAADATRCGTARVVKSDGRFFACANGTVIDTRYRLMWAARDNGSPIDWPAAKEYCKAFRLGGVGGWRLPTLQELETLWSRNHRNPNPPTNGCAGGYRIHRFFHITCGSIWAAEQNGQRPAAFPFYTTERFWHHQTAKAGSRVLPVRELPWCGAKTVHGRKSSYGRTQNRRRCCCRKE